MLIYISQIVFIQIKIVTSMKFNCDEFCLQIEEQAIQELRQHYQADTTFECTITVGRVPTKLATPTWAATQQHPLSPRYWHLSSIGWFQVQCKHRCWCLVWMLVLVLVLQFLVLEHQQLHQHLHHTTTLVFTVSDFKLGVNFTPTLKSRLIVQYCISFWWLEEQDVM